jgi:hypothetical protein
MPISILRSFPSLLAALLLFAAVSFAANPWSTQIVHPVYTPDITLADTVGAGYIAMPEDSLRALITLEGGKGINVVMKQAVYDMARLYQKTKQDIYADRAVLLLERFAEVVPQWPLIDRMDGHPIPISTVNWSDWSNSGFWGIWYPQDLEECVQLPLAYDFIASSGAIERRSVKTGVDVRQKIENDLFRYMIETDLKNGYLLNLYPPMPDGRAPFEYDNMGGNFIIGLIPFGKVFEPGYIHLVTDRIRRYPTVNYFRDGVWQETSPSYHLQITNRLNLMLPDLLKGYSDPPGYVYPADGSRYDDLDVRKGMEGQFARMQAALDHLTLPNGYHLALHDSHSNQRAWYVNRDFSDSYCYFGMRHAVMGRFTGANQVQAFLHFGGVDGHEHLDCLNLGLWALGGELLSEGEYSRFGNRDWNMSSAGHNLVVVNGSNQLNRFDKTFVPGPDDAVDGLSYNPCNYGHGNTKHFGNLRLWDPAHSHLQVVEAEGENAWNSMSRYRRTVVMVETEGTGFYLIDLFRVKGGSTHDWMLHGQLFEDYGVSSSLTLNAASGGRFAYLQVDRQAVTDSLWWSEFSRADGVRIRTTMMGAPGTEVSYGRAPAMRRTGDATFLDVRRRGGDNLFAAVHEPYNGTPRITRITPLLAPGAADSVVCLKIELAGGRTDYFAATLDIPPYPERSIPGTDLKFRGRLAHIAMQNGKPVWMYLLEGGSLSGSGVTLAAESGDFSWRGRITDIKRMEKGDSWNGFVSTAALPDNGDLNGRTLLLTLGDGRTEGYTIARIEKQGGNSLIHVNEEPGMELRDGGSLCKLVYFPWHGVRGDVSFLISGSVYRDSAGTVKATAPLVPQNTGVNTLPTPGNTLYGNFPNPFNPTTTIRFSLREALPAHLTVYNALGQKVRSLVNGPQTPGLHTVQWDGRTDRGRRASSGLYFCRLEIGTFEETRRMLLLE